MNFLTAAKDLEKAKEQIAAHESTIAALTEENAKLKADAEAALALSNDLSAKLTAALAAESEAKAAMQKAQESAKATAASTAAEIEKAAAVKAAQTVASVGHEAVKTAEVKEDLLSAYLAESDPKKRDLMWKANKTALSKLMLNHKN